VLLTLPWLASFAQDAQILRLPDAFAKYGRPDRVRIGVSVSNWEGSAVASVKLRLEGRSIKTASSTDADGRYTFDDLAPGKYSIFAEGTDGLFSNRAERSLTAGVYGVHLSFPNRPVCLDHYGETTVKCLDIAIQQFEADGVVDCGKGYITASPVVKQITICVHENLKRHVAFVARYEVPTTDSYEVDAFVGDSNGHVHALMYDSNGIWDLPEEFKAITLRISSGLYSGGVYVFVDDCSKPRTNFFDWKWTPVPCKPKTR
jgi:hypothetical protein